MLSDLKLDIILLLGIKIEYISEDIEGVKIIYGNFNKKN